MGDQGDCVTGLYRTLTTLGHFTKPGRRVALTNTWEQTHREAAKMRRQRNVAQMREQIKTPEKELNKMEISKLLDAEFKTLVIRMLNELSETFNSIKNDQSEMKGTLTEMKNNSQGINSRVDEAESQISNLEYSGTLVLIINSFQQVASK